MRGYGQRRKERLERIRRRVEFLSERIERNPPADFDQMERSALLWAIEEIERWDAVAEIVSGESSDAGKLAAISTLIRSRLSPSEADLARTPGLAKVVDSIAQFQAARSLTAPMPDGQTRILELESRLSSLSEKLEGLVKEWREVVEQEDNDEWGRERASVRTDDADELSALLGEEPRGRQTKEQEKT
jgi:hypothetical protein